MGKQYICISVANIYCLIRNIRRCIIDRLDLTDRVTIVTGGASGIGETTALTFAQHGSDTAIVDINDELGESLAEKTKEKYSRKCIYYNCDVANYEVVDSTCKKIIKEFGVVDNIVYCAGYGVRVPIVNMDIKHWNKALAVNLSGAFYFVKSLINHMLERKKGNIIIVGSSTTINGGGGGIHYAASKAGLIGIVKGLSYEVLTKGIRANLITPAVIDTPMLRKGYPDTDEVNKKLLAQIPLGRIGKPQDIANAALYLASDMSEYICGQEIIADGGRMLYRSPGESNG